MGPPKRAQTSWVTALSNRVIEMREIEVRNLSRRVDSISGSLG